MPRDGVVTLADLQARGLPRLHVDYPACGRREAYDLARAIERWGANGKLPGILVKLTVDCPRGKEAAIA